VTADPQVRARAAKVKLLLMDVDGVLTNGKLYHFPDRDGNMVETKGFDSQDGIALQWMQWKGLRTGVISGRESLGTAERARQVKMNYVYQGHIEKIPILEKIMADGDLTADEIAYMGDDLTDVVVMRRVGLAIAVANARPEVKRAAHYVTEGSGGDGAVREAIELILDAQGFWAEILEKYEVRPFAKSLS
jgi:3-deoxy-D-manno-octulosonate 8-phosphate phosphatase (KDO 8-P phosphatase)